MRGASEEPDNEAGRADQRIRHSVKTEPDRPPCESPSPTYYLESESIARDNRENGRDRGTPAGEQDGQYWDDQQQPVEVVHEVPGIAVPLECLSPEASILSESKRLSVTDAPREDGPKVRNIVERASVGPPVHPHGGVCSHDPMARGTQAMGKITGFPSPKKGMNSSHGPNKVGSVESDWDGFGISNCRFRRFLHCLH